MAPRHLFVLFAFVAACASEKPTDSTSTTAVAFDRSCCGKAQESRPVEQQLCGGSYGGCPEQYFCDATDCGVGLCRPRPTDCSFADRPVCGCDNRTWLNLCMAQSNGVASAYEGACFEPPFIPSAPAGEPSPEQPPEL